MPLFKLQVQDDAQDASVWHDVKGADGQLLVYPTRQEARASLEQIGRAHV